VQPDGKIIAAGDVTGSMDQIGLVRYNANGSLDTTFGNKGIAVLTNNKVPHEAYDVALQPDGQIDVADGVGAFSAGSVTWNVYQFTANGSLDTSFGKSGQASISLSSPYSGSSGYSYTYCRMVILPPAPGSTEGKIVVDGGVAGNSPYYGGLVGLARFNPGGSLDTTFGTKGMVETALGDGTNATIGHLFKMMLQGDGKIVAAGYAGPGSPTDSNPRYFVVARYNANGSLDGGFGSGGIVTTQVAALGFQGASAVLVQPSDGKIVAVGAARSAATNDSLPPNPQDWALVRYNPDGSLDTGFGNGGIVLAPTTGDSAGGAATFGNDGNIIVAGRNNGSFAVGRYFTQTTTVNGVTYAPGSLDPTFGNNGIATTSVAGGGNGVAIQPDGKIVVAGSTSAQFAVLRFLPSAPEVGSFTANPNPVTAGSSVTLTASNITDRNPNASITQVAFYVDSNGDGVLEPGTDTLLGYGTPSNGTWTLTFSTTNWALAVDTLFAQAADNYGAFSDPVSLSLQVL
jgi:uncharacterized delta-60 repeat protein